MAAPVVLPPAAMRFTVPVAVPAILLLLPIPAAAQRDVPSLGAGRIAAQVGAGILATPLGFVAGGVATEWMAERFGVADPEASRVALAGAWTSAALVTAAMPALIGARGPGRGSYAAALGGTLAGGAGSYLLVRLNDREGDDRPPCRLACSLAAAAVFVLPSVGATVGYNLSRRAVRGGVVAID